MKKIINLIKLLLGKYELSKYNNYTISEYFRKQGAQIGEDCHLGIRQLASEPYLIKIGDKVGIADGTLLLTHTSGWNFREIQPDLSDFGTIEIKNNCYIGANVIILPNVIIGENSLIAAGAIVTRDIPPNSVSAGIPAKVIGNIDDFYLKIRSNWEKIKPPGYMIEIKAGSSFTRRKINQISQLPHNKKILREHLTKHFWGKSR